MAAGSSNQGIADSLVITLRAVEYVRASSASWAFRRRAASRAACSPSCSTCVPSSLHQKDTRNPPPSGKSPVFSRRARRASVLQREDEDHPERDRSRPSVGTGVAAPVADERQTWLPCLLPVVGYFVIGVIHPAEIEVGDDTTLYIGIHLVQPFFILLLAWGTWLLVKDLRASCASGPSRSSRTRSRTPCSTRSPASRWEDRVWRTTRARPTARSCSD